MAAATITTSIVTVAATPTAAPPSRPCAFTESRIVAVFYAPPNDASGQYRRHGHCSITITGGLTRQELIDVANSLEAHGDVDRPLPAGYGE